MSSDWGFLNIARTGPESLNSISSFLRQSVGRCRTPRVRATLMLGLLAVSVSSATTAQEEFPGWAEGRILVKPRAGLARAPFERILARHGGKRLRSLESGTIVVKVAPQAEEAVVRALSRNPHIDFVELDRFVEVAETVTPNDPYYAEAWHLPRIEAPAAWRNTLGDGVVVAVLDTGVDPDHPDLANKMTTGWNAVAGTPDPTDTHDVAGHGTAVSGVVAAQSGNGAGVTSVACDARIMPVRVSDSPGGAASWSDIAAGLDWAVEHGAHVANISYQVVNSYAIREAAQRMRNAGGVVISAAGNSGVDEGFADNPALINVAATSIGDESASYSSYGNYVDLSAPGDSIWTTTDGGGYAAVSGTSFASPVVAGVAGLVLSVNPSLTADEVEQVLQNSADDPGVLGWDVFYGFGRVNAATAVDLAMQTLAPDTTPPAVEILAPIYASNVDGTVTIEVSATDDAMVTEVVLYVNGAYVGSDLTAPYEFSWESTRVSDGEVVLTAYAYDMAGNTGFSNDVTVNVANGPDPSDTTAPRVSIDTPFDNKTVAKNLKIAASATDDTGVTSITIFVDGVEKCASDSDYVSCRWNVNRASKGTHVIASIARDFAGNEAATSITVYK